MAFSINSHACGDAKRGEKLKKERKMQKVEKEEEKKKC